MSDGTVQQARELRPIPGFDGYLAGSDGEVYSTVYAHHWAAPNRSAPPRKKAKWLCPATGYFTVALSITGKERREAVHRLVCAAFNGSRPTATAEVRHLDGSKTNNSPTNLAWGTAAENHADMVRHGTMRTGEGAPQSKVTASQVALIRAAARAGVDKGFLGRRFGITPSAAAAIADGEQWRHDIVEHSAGELTKLLEEYRRYPKRNSGEKNRSAKLNERQVREIRAAHCAGSSIQELASKYGVCYGTIKPIVLGRTWTYLL